MDFDQRIQNAKTQSRTEEVRVGDLMSEGLKDFFDNDLERTWKIRGLEGSEIARASQAVEANRKLSDIVSQIVSSDPGEMVQAIKRQLGADEETPDDFVRRVECLWHGSVDPKISRETAVKIGEAFYADFVEITNRIYSLSGQGLAVQGKANTSTGDQTSKTPSE